MSPTPEQVELARDRLRYFETQLAKTLAGENEQYPIGAPDHAWCVRHYQTEVAERTLLLALWDHIMALPTAYQPIKREP